MSTSTTNYNLTKPDYSDVADIADINGNMDIIDTELKSHADSISTNTSDISSLSSTTTSLSSNKQDKVDNSLTTEHKQIPAAINEVNGIASRILGNIAATSGNMTSYTSLSSLMAWFVTVAELMDDNTIKILGFRPNFTSTFFGGAYQTAILFRITSGVYRVAFPNICGDAYYYSSAWHYTKATMSTVTP